MKKLIHDMAFLSTILGLLISLLVTSSAVASGVGFTPGKLEMDRSPEGMCATLHIINTGTETSNYFVYAEEPGVGWFEISPSEFSLGPSENMPIEIMLSPEHIPLGEFHTKICVVAFADTADARVGAGAKVPVHITPSLPISEPEPDALSEMPNTFSLLDEEASDSPARVDLWIGLVVIVAAILLTMVAFSRRRRKHDEVR